MLLRHGRPDNPCLGRYRGQTGEPLAPRGRWEARQAAERLRAAGVARVFSSDLPRAVETAAIVGEVLGVEVVPTPSLREISFGLFEGRSHAEVRRCFGRDLDFWWEDPVRRGPPGGESLIAVMARVGAWIEAVVEPAAGESVLVVGHDGSLKALLWQALGLAPAAFWRVSLDYGALTGLERSGGAFRLLFLNDACHLGDGIFSPEPQVSADRGDGGALGSDS